MNTVWAITMRRIINYRLILLILRLDSSPETWTTSDFNLHTLTWGIWRSESRSKRKSSFYSACSNLCQDVTQAMQSLFDLSAASHTPTTIRSSVKSAWQRYATCSFFKKPHSAAALRYILVEWLISPRDTCITLGSTVRSNTRLPSLCVMDYTLCRDGPIQNAWVLWVCIISEL